MIAPVKVLDGGVTLALPVLACVVGGGACGLLTVVVVALLPPSLPALR